MNTHDIDIELPPLPGYDGRIDGQWGAFHLGTMQAYARTAIEADRKRRGEPVAWVKQDIAENQFINMRPRRIWWECNEGIGTPIFAAPQPAEPDVLPGEAIFGFAAWLTSLKTPVTFSECHGAAIGADLVAAYNTSQGFIQVREDYYKRLKPYPEDEPSQPAAPEVKS